LYVYVFRRMLVRYSFRANVDHETGENVKTLTIPRDTSRFDIKVGEPFNLKFSAGGRVSHHDTNHFAPPLPTGDVSPNTAASEHAALIKGEVTIHFVTRQAQSTATDHTILIGN
jgi:hypothetical protein